MDCKQSYLEKAYNILHGCRQILQESDWTFDSNIGDVRLEKKYYPQCSIPYYKCSALASNKNPDELFSKVWDVDEAKMKSIDKEIESWKIIESGENFRVVLQRNNLPWPIYPRETIIVQASMHEANENWFVTYSLDDHPLAPKNSNYVRAKIHLNCFGFVKQGNDTIIHKQTLVDPCGMIPSFVITNYSHKMVNMVNYIRE